MSLKKMALLSVLMLTLMMFGVVIPVAASTPEGGAVCNQYHTVQRGETFYRIARTYGLSVNDLQALNGLANINRINVGQQLCVKGTAVSPTPTPGGTSYTVQQGDTLSKIARKFGVNMTVLAQVNGISNTNRIYIGQVLVIPDVTIQS